MFPVTAAADAILSGLRRTPRLIISAPPGSGKSTQVPQILLKGGVDEGAIIVLQPRRIAAVSLAARVAEEMGVELGTLVGFRVRFESRCGLQTRILFTTYGTFLQQLLDAPLQAGVSAVLCDEFHERSLECDTAIAWLRHLSLTRRPDLRLLVLSATLDTAEVQDYLAPSERIEVKDASFGVRTIYLPPSAHEKEDAHIARAFSLLMREGAGGSVLIFCAGMAEMQRAADTLSPLCRGHGYRVLILHGSLPIDSQREVMHRAGAENCAVLSTNVAETSLTIPGIRAVIDTGLARIAAFDPERERNTLYLSRISRASAAQRAGRAGRIGPGICVRLWSKTDEFAMKDFLEPEISRLDISRSLLTLASLRASTGENGASNPLLWLTRPPVARLRHAYENLARCGAITNGGAAPPAGMAADIVADIQLTTLGRAMARLPLEPAVASVLLSCESRDTLDISAAMAALWENERMPAGKNADLFETAIALRSGAPSADVSRETTRALRQLDDIVVRLPIHGTEIPAHSAPDMLRRSVTGHWARAFSHRIAALADQSGRVYLLADGRRARLESAVGPNAVALPPAVIALQVHESGGRGRKLSATISWFLPLQVEWIEDLFPGECTHTDECRWDGEDGKVLVEECLRFRSLALSRSLIQVQGKHRAAASALLAEKVFDGAWNWRPLDEQVQQLVLRIRTAAKAWPELGFPLMGDDDWRLVYQELCEGKTSVAELSTHALAAHIRNYLGASLASFLDRAAPDRIKLPSGRTGKITYFENEPPELSARIGDFIGCPPRYAILDGRVRVTFNILAPNYRTVQKTDDLAGFWKNTYPALKKDLLRKYPRHPWP